MRLEPQEREQAGKALKWDGRFTVTNMLTIVSVVCSGLFIIAISWQTIYSMINASAKETAANALDIGNNAKQLRQLEQHITETQNGLKETLAAMTVDIRYMRKSIERLEQQGKER